MRLYEKMCCCNQFPNYCFNLHDLTKRAVKVGAEKVFVSTRQAASAEQPGDAVSWTGAWPFNKVEVLEEQIPLRVTDNGKNIQLTKVEWEFPDRYVPETGDVSTELRDIDTVIFCTGYVENTSMLDEPLREAVKRDPTLQLEVPTDWKMTENSLTKFLGDVKPHDVRWLNSHVTHPKLYRGMMIDNPSMMFILADVDSPLCGIDVAAWFLVKIITGQRDILSREEMWKQNMADAIHEMQSPVVRFAMDKAYYDAYNNALEQNPDDREAIEKACKYHYSTYRDFNYIVPLPSLTCMQSLRRRSVRRARRRRHGLGDLLSFSRANDARGSIPS